MKRFMIRFTQSRRIGSRELDAEVMEEVFTDDESDANSSDEDEDERE